MDVRCDKAGYLVKTLAQPDETVKVGSVIAEMDTEKNYFVCWQTINEQLQVH